MFYTQNIVFIFKNKTFIDGKKKEKFSIREQVEGKSTWTFEKARWTFEKASGFYFKGSEKHSIRRGSKKNIQFFSLWLLSLKCSFLFKRVVGIMNKTSNGFHKTKIYMYMFRSQPCMVFVLRDREKSRFNSQKKNKQANSNRRFLQNKKNLRAHVSSFCCFMLENMLWHIDSEKQPDFHYMIDSFHWNWLFHVTYS